MPIEPEAPAAGTEKMIAREHPNVEPARAALVTRWLKDIEEARKHWEADYKRMRRNMQFAGGKQWPGQTENDDRFMVNLVQRVLKSTVASLYAKNPTVVMKRRDKLDFVLWDGRVESAAQAQQTLLIATQALAAKPELLKNPEAAAMMAEVEQAKALLADIQQGTERRKMIDKVGKTLVAVVSYFLSESEPTFKLQMKQMMRRCRTTGVGYVKLGYQRLMELSEAQGARIADHADRLAVIGRLTADAADGETDPNAAEAEELRLAIAAIQAEPEKIIREGLVFDFPHSTRIIPSVSTEKLMGWVGSDWVAEEIMLTPNRIKEVYGVDIGTAFKSYRTVPGSPTGGETRRIADRKDGLACVYHVYDKATGMQLVVCEGYPDFLKEPGTPDVFIEQFFPYFPVTFNDMEEEGRLFPKSDVELLLHIQKEFNRSKEALRQHRIANRPLYVSPNGSFEEDEVKSLQNYPAHAVIALNGIEKGRPASDVLAPVTKINIDPNLYETNSLFEDMQRVTGNAEANLGGTAGSTATESTIAETSRQGSVGLDSDDLDDMLTALFRSAGSVLLTELKAEAVKEIAGVGAVWPELSRAEIAKEVWLEVKAGSSGRPNQARDAANFERVYPLLVQIPGVSPRWLAEVAIAIADDNVDMEDAIIEGLPSIMAQNALVQPPTGDPASDPSSQGDKGGENKAKPKAAGDNGQPAFPGAGPS
jgi:hypothetical protein